MITGDHKDTAVAIAKELGIISDASEAITDAELDNISDDEICEFIKKYGVYARVQPEHKTRIVNAWKANDAITAMIGSLLLTTAVLEIPFLAHAFGFEMIFWTEYAIAIGLAILVIPIVEIVKLIQRKLSK